MNELESAQAYAKFQIEGTSKLAFRDIPKLVQKYQNGTLTLDFGCGTGRSTRFLKSLNLNVIGVDQSEGFISEALHIDTDIQYQLIANNQIPYFDEMFDLVFSSLTFQMIPSISEMKVITLELNRVLNEDGVCIIVTGSEYMHDPKKQWVSYFSKYPENNYLYPGKKVKLRIKDNGAEFNDYQWTDQNYQQVFKSCGFKILEKSRPIALPDDNSNNWQSERLISPFILYVLKKRTFK